MPLAHRSKYGGECPLQKFKVDAHGSGYTADPVEACIQCNFADTSVEGFDLAKICQCPADMTWDEYERLKKAYEQTEGKKTKPGFQEFVNQQRGG